MFRPRSIVAVCLAVLFAACCAASRPPLPPIEYGKLDDTDVFGRSDVRWTFIVGAPGYTALLTRGQDCTSLDPVRTILDRRGVQLYVPVDSHIDTGERTLLLFHPAVGGRRTVAGAFKASSPPDGPTSWQLVSPPGWIPKDFSIQE